MKKALTIAGSDSSGGAGIQADLKTFAANGVYGMSVITAVTAQNTQGVLAVDDISIEVVQKQLEAIFEDIEVDSVKIGMVSSSDTIDVISCQLHKYRPDNIVVDPVMVSKNGYHLLQPEAARVLVEKLFPLAMIVTPNIPEAELIAGMEIKGFHDMETAAARIYKLGPKNVLLKGGHLPDQATDILFDGNQYQHFKGERIPTRHTHGTGCTLSAAIAANLAKGMEIPSAVEKAKEYLTMAIAHSLAIGKGIGPTNHFYDLYQKTGLLE
jgi:hydroxymethylpyrimidine/phosphomethylpyrimidine kinase